MGRVVHSVQEGQGQIDQVEVVDLWRVVQRREGVVEEELGELVLDWELVVFEVLVSL